METTDRSYVLWKQRGEATPRKVTWWAVPGIIIGLFLIFAYGEVGKGGKGWLIAIGTMIMDRVGTVLVRDNARTSLAMVGVGFLIALVGVAIRVWAVVDVRRLARRYAAMRAAEQSSASDSAAAG